jgi:predicted metalloprotease with PDZ domain
MEMRIHRLIALFSVVVLVCSACLAAPSSILLSVDARELYRKILHAKETVTMEHSGPVTLFYPRWIPGEHGPTGPIVDLIGLHISAGGRELAWRRDLVEMYAIHCDLPAGLLTLELAFDFVTPADAAGFSSGASATPSLALVSWNQVVLYPMDQMPDSILVTPSITLPDGWKFGTALETAGAKEGGAIHFKPLSLTMLIDSPVLTGTHFRAVDVSAGLPVRHTINICGDGEETLAMPEETKRHYDNLVLEANSLFGAHHYSHYDFLYTLSDYTAHFGLEHHQSSDDRVDAKTLLDQDLRVVHASLLSHEFVHSWNGKYRRPTGLATGDYSTPMKGDLLWVYEGLTQYLGNLLAARSGLWTPEEYRDHLAVVAASLDEKPGRKWRPLQDTNDEAQLLYSARNDWDTYRRGVDFYDEGDLLWLEVDMKIRQLTAGKKSMNDFCRLFHGGESRGPEVKPYTFDDVVAALNAVAPSDWKEHLIERLQSLNEHAPLGGIQMGGWRLVFRDTLSAFERCEESARKYIDLQYSLGMVLADDGMIKDVVPGSPAYASGAGPGMQIIAVNGRKFSKRVIREALADAKSGKALIDILVQNQDIFTTYRIDYHGGERYPHLERDASQADELSRMIEPLTRGASSRGK